MESQCSPELEGAAVHPLPGTFTSVIAEADPGELILSDVPVFEELLNGGGSQEDGQEDTSTLQNPTLSCLHACSF